jgi:hypothetical protein
MGEDDEARAHRVDLLHLSMLTDAGTA